MGCAGSKDGQDPSKKDTGPTTLVGTHLKSCEDIVELPQFPEGTKSLLKKYLTRDVWNKLKD
jgi:hypothetical protein